MKRFFLFIGNLAACIVENDSTRAEEQPLCKTYNRQSELFRTNHFWRFNKVFQDRGIFGQAFPLLPSPFPCFIILEIISLHDFLSSNLLDIGFVGMCLLSPLISVLLLIKRSNIVTEDHYQKLSVSKADRYKNGPFSRLFKAIKFIC